MEYRAASESERVSVARRHLDAVEMWLRRLVDRQFLVEHGDGYFRPGIISSAIRGSVERVRKSSPEISRDIDATTLENLISIITNPDHFHDKFLVALKEAFPNGPNEAKVVLDRLASIRNSVQHGNGCTTRQLERAVCYSNDVIESIKSFYMAENIGKRFNVPTFVRATDNFGHAADSATFKDAGNFRILEWEHMPTGTLSVGDQIVLEVEIDPNFDPDAYDVIWWMHPSGQNFTGTKLDYTLSERDVSELTRFYIKVVTKKSWHRYGDHDDHLVISYAMLPPED